MSYDEKCEELARHFLPDCHTEQPKILAQWIQDAIEDWLAQASTAKWKGDWLEHHLHAEPSTNCHLCQAERGPK